MRAPMFGMLRAMRCTALAAGLLVASTAHAGVVNVSTPGELMTAIANAAAGDEIVLANGTYALGDVSCTADGTAAQPIIVRSTWPSRPPRCTCGSSGANTS